MTLLSQLCSWATAELDHSSTWGISRPNNGCFCFLHLLDQDSFKPLFLPLSGTFHLSVCSRLTHVTFAQFVNCVAKHRGNRLSDVLTVRALANITSCDLSRLFLLLLRTNLSQTYSCWSLSPGWVARSRSGWQTQTQPVRGSRLLSSV